MTEDYLEVPHPLVTSETLYLANVPSYVDWVHLEPTLSKCGLVTPGDRDQYAGRRGWVWTVHFRDVFHAEMALATLQNIEIPGVEPPYSLQLSHSPQIAPSVPSKPLFPQYVKSKILNHPIQLCTPQKLFQWFRHAGPLVYVRVGVDLGFAERTCIFEYWDDVHAAYAQTHCRSLHTSLRGMKPFFLRIIVPTNLTCSNLGATIHENDIRGRFKRFGKINGIRVIHPNTAHRQAFVNYSTRESAAEAQKEMHGKMFGEAKIVVRFVEPQMQDVFRFGPRPTPQPQSRTADEPQNRSTEHEQGPSAAPRQAPPRPTAEGDSARQAPQADDARQRKQAELLRLRDEAQRRRAEASRISEANARKREAAAVARQAAQDAARDANLRRRAAEADALDQERETARARKSMAQADEAFKEAERVFEEAKARLDRAKERLKAAAAAAVVAEKLQDQASQRRRDALAEETQLVSEKEQAEKGEAEVLERTRVEDDDARRQADLAESMWKLNDLYVQEEKDWTGNRGQQSNGEPASEHRAGVNGGGTEESGARMTEEEEAIAEEELHRRAYEDAASRERERCHLRDNGQWSSLGGWTVYQAMNRFMAVSAEFDTIRFSASQPLTFGSIPWPLLRHPNNQDFDTIEWRTVEQFFSSVRVNMVQSEYKLLVEKAHRRFHPDKWKSRGLLITVLDAELRDQLEAAGNVVAQALTPLWIESKSMA